jgi:transcriptional regulator with XRE-family HTH domain
MRRNNTIIAPAKHSPDAILKGIAAHVKTRRLEMDLTQRAMASRANMSTPSYRRFETTGEVSFRSLVNLGVALDISEDLFRLFSTKGSEVTGTSTQGNPATTRKRGRRNE